MTPSGYYRYNGKLRDKYVHVHVWEKLNGPLESGEVVRHLCNNTWCVEPTHLSKGTKQDDIHDQIRSGTFNRQKLSIEQVREIRRQYRTTAKTMQKLANEYGVNVSAISRIINRVRWKNDY